MRYLKTAKWLLLILFLIILMITLMECSSPLTVALDPIKKNYRVEPLIPPRAGLEPGWIYRPKDFLVLNTKCYEGDRLPPAAVIGLENIEVEYNNNSSISSDWNGWVSLKVDFKRVGKIRMALEDIQELTLTNVRPTFDPSCLTRDYLADRPIIGALLQVGSIHIEFHDTKGSRIMLSSDKLKELAEIDFSGQMDINKHKNLVFSGKKLNIGLKKLDPFVRRVSDEATYTKEKDGFESRILKYQVFIKSIRRKGNEWKANLVLVNKKLVPPLKRSFEEIGRGDIPPIIEYPNRRDYMHLKEVDAEGIKLEFLSISYHFERGVKISK